MEDFDYSRGGVTYLQTDSRLSARSRTRLLISATVLYLGEVDERDVSGEDFSGKLYKRGGIKNLGTFSGQQFEAELDTNHGKSKLRFLVTERISHSLN